MYPVLFEVGGFAVTSFGVMMFLSFIGGAWALSAQLERRGIDKTHAWDVLAWVAIAGIVGAKLYYVALHWQDLVADPVRELTARGGLVWYGGFIGGVTAYYVQVKRRNLPLATMFDAVAPALMLAYAIGRVGCFLVGDDYGLPTDSWVGIAFPNGAPPSTAANLRDLGADIPADVAGSTVLSVHPTQLYEVGAALLLFGVLWRLSSHRLASGQLWAAYMIMYGAERFLVEFVRAKGDRYLFGLSTAQLASLAIIGFGAWLWHYRARVAPPSARAAPQPQPAGAAAASGRARR